TTPRRLRGCILLPPAPWPHELTLSGVGTVVNLAFTAAATRNVTVTVPSNCRPLWQPSLDPGRGAPRNSSRLATRSCGMGRSALDAAALSAWLTASLWPGSGLGGP